MREHLTLFIDGSVEPVSKRGCGAYMIIPTHKIHSLTEAERKPLIKVVRFSSTSSTECEVLTLMKVLQDNLINWSKDKKIHITVYTDSQNLASLPKRKIRLQKNDYMSRNRFKTLKNSELYKKFYRLTEQIDCEIIKIKGHSPLKEKSHIDHIFKEVDRASRKALRDDINNKDEKP